MPYNVSLVEFSTTSAVGVSIPGLTFGGFPSTPFNYLVASLWVCLPYGIVGGGNPHFTIGWPFFFANLQAGGNILELRFSGAVSNFFDATYNPPFQNLRTHVLVSVNCVTQVTQVYINDVSISPSGGGFASAGNFSIGLDRAFDVTAADSVGGHGPAMADLWVANTAGFVDLTVTANRRKFINADLSPVFLNTNGTEPFGIQPPVFLTVHTGGVATDFAANYGSGPAFGIVGTGTLGFQSAGVCTLPPPPPTPPAQLALDNVIATATTTLLSTNLISLRWSDDRGHSYGSPVSQSIGEAGEYRTSLQWQRLAYARDRVFEISWSVPMRTALQGCWVDVTPAQS